MKPAKTGDSGSPFLKIGVSIAFLVLLLISQMFSFCTMLSTYRILKEFLLIRGNQAYKSGDLSKAEMFYTQGIVSVPSNERSGSCLEPLLLCYSNRAAARMQLQSVREAIGDCLTAAALDPSFIKAHLRAAK